jgi:hypothetical protein
MTPEELDQLEADMAQLEGMNEAADENSLINRGYRVIAALREAWVERDELEEHLDLCHTEGPCVHRHRKTMEAIRKDAETNKTPRPL